MVTVQSIRLRRSGVAMFLLLFVAPVFSQVVITDLTRTQDQYDYVIVSPPSYVSTVAPLAELRVARDGLRVGIAITDSIFKTYGVDVPADSAIKRFMMVALSTWRDPKPQYFLLAGNINAVPSHKQASVLATYMSEDSVLLDSYYVLGPSPSDGKVRPMACLGRLPAWDSVQLGIMVQKTITYEQSVAGRWASRSIAVADSTPQDGSIWEEQASRWQNGVRPVWNESVDIHLRPSSANHASRAEFRDRWNEGAALVMLCGHANWYTFSATRYFTTWDVDSLADNSPMPVCLLEGNQRYERIDTVALSVRLLAARNKGSVGIIAPSGMHYQSEYEAFAEALAASLVSTPGPRLGKALLAAAQVRYDASPELVRRLTLLGDPALTVKNTRLAGVSHGETLPSDIRLHPNYPNPFNPTTTIAFDLPAEASVTLEIYNVLGARIETLVAGVRSAGTHRVSWNAGTQASGVYLCRLIAGERMMTQKLLLMK
jgi:hypothetical protein